MPRPKRLEFPGAIYLVTLTGYPGGHVFYDPQIFKRFPDNPRNHAPDAEQFETLIWETCEQYEARIHAYVLEPNTALAVIQTLGGPLGWIMHDVLRRYSVHLLEQHRIPKGSKPFQRRYKAQIVQPAKLPYAVRYVQRREITPDPRRHAANHPFSSSLIYGGRRSRPEGFVVNAMHEALARLGYLGPSAYFEFMAAPDSPSIAHMLSRHVIGDERFCQSVSNLRRNTSPDVTPEAVLREVSGTILRTEPDVVCSSTHRGALARALVAWYAMRTGTAQIGTVARWFGVTSSDLRYLIRRHRRKIPEHFSIPLPDLFPTAQAGSANRYAQPHSLLRVAASTHALSRTVP